MLPRAPTLPWSVLTLLRRVMLWHRGRGWPLANCHLALVTLTWEGRVLPGIQDTTRHLTLVQPGDSFHSRNCVPAPVRHGPSSQTWVHASKSLSFTFLSEELGSVSLRAPWETSAVGVSGFSHMLAVPALGEWEMTLVPLWSPAERGHWFCLGN